MNKLFRYTFSFLLLLSGLTAIATSENTRDSRISLPVSEQEPDSIKPRYSVRKTVPETLEDIKEVPVDFKDPDNIKTEITYDEKNNQYIIGKKAGDQYIETPIYLTPEEYNEWSMRKSLEAYYRSKNNELLTKEADKFSFADMKFDIGPAEKIFGPGGVQIKTQGSAEIKMGVKYNKIDNPALLSNRRKTIGFDFDEKINISVNGKVGDKVNLNMNYNTDATFDFDTKKIKLKYEGKEDEIIKLLEAGNVSMPSNNSLVRGATTLFGIRADLQFGKLNLQTVVSQQESESKTVTSKGGAQTTDFELTVDNYDENRHFFLAHFFRDNYDKNMSQLPNIASGIVIENIEVWVTNKRGNYDNPRNIVTFMDLGERDSVFNSNWKSTSPDRNPYNKVNKLYDELNKDSTLRDIDLVTQNMPSIGSNMEGGRDYEKIENARLLTSSEYTLNKALGYISLRQTLQPDEVLAVAYNYTYKGKKYQVGEFSSDIKNTKASLFLKLLKNTANSPGIPTWHLMMKNVYSLNAYQVQKDRFRLNVLYLSDTTGVYLNYIPEGIIKTEILLRVMNLDRLDTKNQRNPDGIFDFVEGYTVIPQNGRIIFPVVEPFGSHLRKQFGDTPPGREIAEKYVYQELYDSTKTVARQIAEKNKFKLKGQYRASSGSEIRLEAMNVPPGSVKVTAGGQTLVENSDYTVDYTMGVVTILNQSIVDAGTPISVNLESNTNFSMQRKTMLGLNFTYDFTKDFQFGGTIMHLKEKPMTTKVAMGDEPISNTLWGLNTSFKKQSQWLTNMIDKLPLINATQPSNISFTAEFAHLIPGHAKGIQDDASYIDDFESTKIGIDVKYPYYWTLSSVPSDLPDNIPRRVGFGSRDSIVSGMDRALLSWYNIDPLFTRKNSSLTPSHIKGNDEILSNHYVREIPERELFPAKELSQGQPSMLSILNLAYYPDERGPYNLDPDLTPDGKLNEPQKRWGGMMRKIDTSDFEASNIEYIEFWMLDPFIYDENHKGGDFYINLGEISEDILKDGKKFFENGLPTNDTDTTKTTNTVWGRVPKERSIVYAFDAADGARVHQDVGLNGLSSAKEREFGTYQKYLNEIQGKLSPEVFEKFWNDPAGDNFHYFRGTDYDQQELGILERYKYINNTEGNSRDNNNSPERYSTSVKTMPDIEDINEDNTLNEFEKYFQYKITLNPNEMVIGKNKITNIRTATASLRNGTKEDVKWYQFKIPVKKYDKTVGGIKDFKSIRFMRMYLTNFEQPVVLRFATMELVRGEWRTYEQALSNESKISGTLDISAVNLEENGDKEPVNYVMPPGISRVIDPSQPQLRQQNEQALSFQVKDLDPGDSRAIYKNTGMDMRQYKRLQMFVHAEALMDNTTNLQDNEMFVFVRLGSDYKNNYYEYAIPLKLTPPDHYSPSTESALMVWPKENMLDIPLSLLTELKKDRNTKRNIPGKDVSYGKIHKTYDPSKPGSIISIIGNPSLAEVKTIMIGVRNDSRYTQSAEIWVNELRLTEFDEEGGWAAQGNLNIQLSDLGTVNVGGHVETVGFGGLEQSVSERRLDDYYQYNFTTNFELGKFFPVKAKVSAPIYFSYSKELTNPKYDPTNQDLLLKDALDTYFNKHEKDSIKRIAQEVTSYKNFSLSNIRVGITSKNPMPYDPANFTLGYSSSKRYNAGNTTDFEVDETWQANFGYAYSPAIKPWEPFKGMKSKSNWLKIIKEINFNWLPQNISFNTDMSRHYYELKLRDLDNPDGTSDIPLTYSQEFFWNRDFSIRWDLTKALRLSFVSGTQAEIEEPYRQGYSPYRDEYSMWKDSVKHSIMSLGRPLDYRQNFTGSYQLPLNKIPIFDWITSDVKYSAIYTWNRGTELMDGTAMNTIANNSSFDVNGRLNLETLYNKVPFLKETNRKFATNTRAANRNQRPAKPKKFEQEIQLKPDTTVTVSHNVNSKRPKVTALTQEGKRYILKYKVLDNNKIRINNLDSIMVKITVVPGPKPEDQTWYKMAQYAARFTMMVRNISVTYRSTNAMTIPGFLPEVGDILGQKKYDGLFSPGLDFAFGLQGTDYLQKAARNHWLSNDTLSNNQASTNAMEDLQLRVTLEPFRDFKIDLNASRMRTDSRYIQYMYPNADGTMPETRSGNFNMTIITIGSAFGGGNANNGYRSKTFDKFLNNLNIIQGRINAKYEGRTPPSNTRADGAAQPTATTQGINKYSPDVMIPAFLAAYTGRDASSSVLDLFPGILSMMPNWRITYSGLSKLSFFKKHFKSFNLNHSYRSTYSIGSFNTFQTFRSFDNLGYIEDVTTGEFIPSGMYDVSNVSINEQFGPLIGVDMTFNNNITAKVEVKKTRTLTLSMAANQIVESGSDDYVIGLGYKLTNVKLFGGNTKNNQKNPVSNDLNLRADFSLRNQSALCRNIQEEYTQATSGNRAIKMSFSADYTFSRLLTLRLYYDRQKNVPLVSSVSYPVTSADFGVSLRFSLTR